MRQMRSRFLRNFVYHTLRNFGVLLSRELVLEMRERGLRGCATRLGLGLHAKLRFPARETRPAKLAPRPWAAPPAPGVIGTGVGWRGVKP
jgi:hypothetical protein